MNTDICPICFDDVDNDINKVITLCKHVFHSTCLVKNIVSNGIFCPNCRHNLTGESDKYDDEDDEEYNYNNSYDEDDDDIFSDDDDDDDNDIVVPNITNEDEFLQAILLEQQRLFPNFRINYSNHEIIKEFINLNFENVKNMLITKQYKYYKGTYKFNDELDDKPEFIVCNTIRTQIDKFSGHNNFIFCIRAHKIEGNKYEIKSWFICKDIITSSVSEDFNISEYDFNRFMDEIEPEINNSLVCEKYNIIH